MKPKIASALAFNNFNIAVFDEHGEQIPELQVGLLTLWAEHAESLGYDLSTVLIESSSGKWRFAKDADGWHRVDAK